jgi:DNA repair protein RadA/Sms
MGDAERPAPGTAIFAGMEGTRPLLVEVQALVSPSTLGTPRRTAVGWDSTRLSMILAVLEARAGVSLGQHDVYLNVAGGLRLKEPAADLAVAAALLSSMADTLIPQGTVLFGEIALSGAIRPVGQTEARLKEAQKLGLGDAVIAEAGEISGPRNLNLRRMATVADLVAWVSSRAKGLRRIA